MNVVQYKKGLMPTYICVAQNTSHRSLTEDSWLPPRVTRVLNAYCSGALIIQASYHKLVSIDFLLGRVQ